MKTISIADIRTAGGFWVRTPFRVVASITRSPQLMASIALFGFIALPVAIWFFVPLQQTQALNPTLMTITVAIAVFSVNMSLTIPKSSAYKDVHGDAPLLHVLLIVILLLVATAPIPVATFYPHYQFRVSFIALFTVTYGSVVLLAAARRESDPVTLIQRSSTRWRILTSLDSALERARRDWIVEQPAIVDRRDRPMHEYGSSIVLKPIRCSIQRLEDIARVAVATGDTVTYSACLLALVKAVDLTDKYPVRASDAHEIRETAMAFGRAPLARVTKFLVAGRNRERLAELSIHTLTAAVKSELRATGESPRYAPYLLGLSSILANYLLREKSPSGALAHLIAVHHIIECQVAGVATVTTEEGEAAASKSGTNGELRPKRPATVDIMKQHEVAALVQAVTDAGLTAIDIENSDFLYRCMDVLSYLGCFAIRRNLYVLGKECARGLCQLGRVSRHAQLECHWDKCLLTPLDHADEKLNHIVTWIAALPEASQRHWGDMFEEVESRLHGFKIELKISISEGKPTLEFVGRKDSPHIVSFSSNAGSRSLDYSDHSMLKDIDWL